MTEHKDFSGQVFPVIADTEYLRCKFNHPAPVVLAGEERRGVRIFPGDDTPRIFINCSLVNAEPPPGSILTNCLTCMKERNVVTSVDTLTIDSKIEVIEHHSDFVYGKYDSIIQGYVDFTPPDEQVID